jgi:hypothetical protein
MDFSVGMAYRVGLQEETYLFLILNLEGFFLPSPAITRSAPMARSLDGQPCLALNAPAQEEKAAITHKTITTRIIFIGVFLSLYSND